MIFSRSGWLCRVILWYLAPRGRVSFPVSFSGCYIVVENEMKMKRSKSWFFSILINIFLGTLMLTSNHVAAQQEQQLVRLAKLVIDPAQLEKYNAILKEEIQASVKIEPGVLTLYAVAEKNDPTKVTILEIYANQDAYQKHILTSHFLKYKEGTKGMVKSLELVEATPLIAEMKIK